MTEIPVKIMTDGKGRTALEQKLAEIEAEVARLLRENERLRIELEAARKPVVYGYPDGVPKIRWPRPLSTGDLPFWDNGIVAGSWGA